MKNALRVREGALQRNREKLFRRKFGSRSATKSRIHTELIGGSLTEAFDKSGATKSNRGNQAKCRPGADGCGYQKQQQKEGSMCLKRGRRSVRRGKRTMPNRDEAHA